MVLLVIKKRTDFFSKWAPWTKLVFTWMEWNGEGMEWNLYSFLGKVGVCNFYSFVHFQTIWTLILTHVGRNVPFSSIIFHTIFIIKNFYFLILIHYTLTLTSFLHIFCLWFFIPLLPHSILPNWTQP